MELLFLILFESKEIYQNFVLRYHFKSENIFIHVMWQQTNPGVSYPQKEYLPRETRVENLMNKAITPGSLELTKTKTGV